MHCPPSPFRPDTRHRPSRRPARKQSCSDVLPKLPSDHTERFQNLPGHCEPEAHGILPGSGSDTAAPAAPPKRRPDTGRTDPKHPGTPELQPHPHRPQEARSPLAGPSRNAGFSNPSAMHTLAAAPLPHRCHMEAWQKFHNPPKLALQTGSVHLPIM